MAARGQVSIDYLPELVIKGIKSARAEYHKMAGEYTRDFPEYMVTTHVARQLHKKYGNGTVTLETVSDEVLARRSGRPHKESKKKRYDIVLWRKDGYARAAIEIKHQQANKTLVLNDLARVFRALDAGKEIQVGAIAYCYEPVSYANKRESVKTQRQKAVEYRDDILTQAKRLLRGKGYSVEQSSYTSRGDDVWVCGCLILKHRPGTKNDRTKKNRAAK